MSVRRVTVQPKSLDVYRGIVDDDLYERIIGLRSKVRGLSAIELNATANGGGVAEMLRSIVPLLAGLGIEADWYVLDEAEDGFFTITKKMHNMLQGRQDELSEFERVKYLRHAERFAASLRRLMPDVWMVHDPQPLAISAYLDPGCSTRVWRSHIDTSHPNQAAVEFLLPFIRQYDWSIFSLPEYAPAGLARERVLTFQPAIDPLALKNQPVDVVEADEVMRRLGIDPDRPLVVQVSRFDPWKDPLGVIDAYRLARQEIPGLQLALVGVFSAQDDPEAPVVYAQAEAHRRGDPNIHLFRDPEQVGDPEVRAFQTAADVVLQKSLREGFGLTVTEAMWKGKPVIGGNAGGIKMQIQDGVNGFLVDSVADCAERIVRLMHDDELRAGMGEAARESVRRNFLLPRLLYDYLSLFAEGRAVAPCLEESALRPAA